MLKLAMTEIIYVILHCSMHLMLHFYHVYVHQSCLVLPRNYWEKLMFEVIFLKSFYPIKIDLFHTLVDIVSYKLVNLEKRTKQGKRKKEISLLHLGMFKHVKSFNPIHSDHENGTSFFSRERVSALRYQRWWRKNI